MPLITEQICIDVVKTLYGCTSTMKLALNLDDAAGAQPNESKSTIEHALPTGDVYRQLLARYALTDIEGAVRWLEIGGYIRYSGYGFAPRMAIQLTLKGVELAEKGLLKDEERALVYQEDPYAAFVARQFRDEDALLFQYLQQSVLAPIGIEALDGRVDGIEAFRGDILRKIRSARFFVCILTRREQLTNGKYASSVWLYQETGAAVAFGKKPLILVEDGMDDHFAGELQKNYEYIPFYRIDFKMAFHEVGRRVQSDLQEHHIPLRAAAI
jgi:hypothetical protein